MLGSGTSSRLPLLLGALALAGCAEPQRAPTPAPVPAKQARPLSPSKTPREWLARLRTHPAVGCAELRENRKLFPLSRRAPGCGALHPLPPYRTSLVRSLAARPAPELVAFARRFLSLAPFDVSWRLPKRAQAALDLQTHLCVDVLGATGGAGARASLASLGREPLGEEDDDEDDSGEEGDDEAAVDPGRCLTWHRQRARLAGALLAGRVPPSLVRARREVVRFLREHVGKDGRIGAAWVHPPRWPCRARAEDDGAPAELVTALGCLALLGERDAVKLLGPAVRWLCAALPRTRTHAHPKLGCLDDLCRCEELGPREEALILWALTAARDRGVERARATAAIRLHRPHLTQRPVAKESWTLLSLARLESSRSSALKRWLVPRAPTRAAFAASAFVRSTKLPRLKDVNTYPSTDAPLDLWLSSVGLLGKLAADPWERWLWAWRLAQRLERSFEARNEDPDDACPNALGEEAPAQEAALWLLGLSSLRRWVGSAPPKGTPSPAPLAPRIQLRGSGRGWLALRAELSLGLLLRGYRPVETPAPRRLRVTQRETDSEWRVVFEQSKSKARSAVHTNTAVSVLARKMLVGLGLQQD